MPGSTFKIGIELLQNDLQPAMLEQRAERGGGKSFAQGTDHAAGDENVFHVRGVYLWGRNWQGARPSRSKRQSGEGRGFSLPSKGPPLFGARRLGIGGNDEPMPEAVPSLRRQSNGLMR